MLQMILLLLSIGGITGNILGMDQVTPYHPSEVNTIMTNLTSHLMNPKGLAQDTSKFIKDFNAWKKSNPSRLSTLFYGDLMDLQIPLLEGASLAQVQVWSELLKAKLQRGEGFTDEDRGYLANSHANQKIIERFSEQIQDLAQLK